MDPEYPYFPTTTTNTTNVVYTFNRYKAHDGESYEAVNEEPRVFCSSGPTPVDALRAMSDILAKNKIKTWTASSVHFDDDGVHYFTIYV
jgi:hypothetical protein